MGLLLPQEKPSLHFHLGDLWTTDMHQLGQQKYCMENKKHNLIQHTKQLEMHFQTAAG